MEERYEFKYFYIRYSRDNPHVRLRIKPRKNGAKRDIKLTLKEYIENLTLSDAQIQPDDPIQWVPYNRETNRYGGPKGVRLAEHFFQCSSEVCFDLLQRCQTQGNEARLGKGLLAMITLLNAFLNTRNAASDFTEVYNVPPINTSNQSEPTAHKLFKKGYESQVDVISNYVNKTWSHLDSGISLTEPLDKYYDGLLDISQKFYDLCDNKEISKNGNVLSTRRKAFYAIIPSYIHMTNNRLGISPTEECYISYLISRTLNAN